MLELNHIRKRFSEGRKPTLALQDLSLSVKGGSFVSIIGPSGCGKTTLLKLVGGLTPPTSGSITICGKSPAEARAARQFGWIFQDPALFPWRTVRQNIELPAEIIGTNGALTSPDSLIELVRLKGFEDALPAELSGGMRSRVAIARALSFRPAFLMMDEPFGSLDEMTRDRMQTELLRIWDHAKNTVLFVTHSISEAAFLADEVVVMSAPPGRVLRIVSVPFPRPRDLELRKTEGFLALVEKLRGYLETALSEPVPAAASSN